MKKKSIGPKILAIILVLLLVIGGVGFWLGNLIYNFTLDPANYSYAVKDDSDIDVKYIREEYKNNAKKARVSGIDNEDLFGYYQKDDDKHDWVMLIHGFNGTNETFPIASELKDKGYNTLVFSKIIR